MERDKCKRQGLDLIRCDQFQEWWFSHPNVSTRGFEYCPWCRERIKPIDNNDLWLYDGAIVELIYRTNRKAIIYTGQQIDTEYYVRNTPWEFMPEYILSIEIDENGFVNYQHDDIDILYSFLWMTCPESLKGCKLKRPDWTKYLVEKEGE